MALRKAQPIKWVPESLNDSVDASTAPKGAMASLQNLIPDPSTPNVFIPRPAAISLTSFGGFTTPAQLTALFILGNLAYGMVASATFTAHDEPFCYDLVNAAFIAITGTTLANTPATQSTSGDWTPPTMDLISTKIIVTHPGFDGATHFFGTLDVSNPAAPTWTSGNTATNALPSVPIAVANFYGRAWYACGNKGFYSDILVPGTITNASQAITLGDSTSIVALKGTPLTAALTGGIVQSLIAFKNNTMFQVLGDAASSSNPLSQNALNVGFGTYAPLSITSTPLGLAFIAPDGLRIIDQSANVSEPVGANGLGVSMPFINSTTQSRICAAFNVETLRISVPSFDNFGNTTYYEYWLNMTRKQWTGPHTFPASLIAPYKKTFLLASATVTAKLYQSDIITTSSTIYTENGATMSFSFQTSLLPDNDSLSNNQVVESSIDLQSLSSSATYNFLASDEQGNTLSQISQVMTSNNPIWNVVVWGAFIWGATSRIQQRPITWDKPLVFRQMQIQISGNSTTGLKIGTLYMRYQLLGYQQRLT